MPLSWSVLPELTVIRDPPVLARSLPELLNVPPLRSVIRPSFWKAVVLSVEETVSTPPPRLNPPSHVSGALDWNVPALEKLLSVADAL